MVEAPATGSADECRCEVTGFRGLEAQVLELRNTNRGTPETLQYLNWRYGTSADMPPPRLYWLLSPQAARIGMAAAIFRPYWVEGRRQAVAVVGDISIDARWRGRGLGARLLEVMTRDLEAHFPSVPALVIPTQSARRALAHSGWIDAGQLQEWVCVLDGARFVQRFLGSAAARRVGATVRAAVGWWLRRFVPAQGRLEIQRVASSALKGLPAPVAPPACVLRELSTANLEWRYQSHPHCAFRFASLSSAGRKRALLVFEQDSVPGSVVIYELHATDAAQRRALLASFVEWARQQPQLKSVRMQLAAAHPLRADLRALGFLRRRGHAVFQLHATDQRLLTFTWLITQGDKET